MADEEHVERLKHSVCKWNQWRREYREIPPDLSYADLSGASLGYANLSYATPITTLSYTTTRPTLGSATFKPANPSYTTLTAILGYTHNGTTLGYETRQCTFKPAILSHADLSHADLSHAILHGANLHQANLSHARFYQANLSSTKLIEANLSYTKLGYANLSHANLSHANLSGATLLFTVFAQNDLRTVKGLVELLHKGPSRIELHSVKLPQDGSALHFLRGAGVPDEWIDDYRARMMHPIHYYSLFISYSSQDETLARRLHADLQDQGVRCWFAPHDLRPGQLIRKGIDEAIHMQDKLLLILSEHSFKSGWVAYEVESALAREIRQQREILFPIRIDDAVFHCTANWATSLRDQRHIGDFTQWAEPLRYQQVFGRLLRDLKANDAKPRKPE